jgi:type III secretory pathway component EscS
MPAIFTRGTTSWLRQPGVFQELTEKKRDVQGLNRLTWLMPASVAVFVVYLVFALVGGIKLNVPIWLILIASFPAIGITWVGIVVALLDASKRPKSQITDEARIVWLLMLCILNILALLPYWLIVIRRNPEITP